MSGSGRPGWARGRPPATLGQAGERFGCEDRLAAMAAAVNGPAATSHSPPPLGGVAGARGRVFVQPHSPPPQKKQQQQMKHPPALVAQSTAALTAPASGLTHAGGSTSVTPASVCTPVTQSPYGSGALPLDVHPAAGPALQQAVKRLGSRVASESSPPLSRLDTPIRMDSLVMARSARSQSPSALPLSLVVTPSMETKSGLAWRHGYATPSSATREAQPGRALERLDPPGRYFPERYECTQKPLEPGRSMELSRSPPPPAPRGEPIRHTPSSSPSRVAAPGHSIHQTIVVPLGGSVEAPPPMGVAAPASLSISTRKRPLPPNLLPAPVVRVSARTFSGKGLDLVQAPASDVPACSVSDSPLSEDRIQDLVQSLLDAERERWQRELQSALTDNRQLFDRLVAAEAGAVARVEALEERVVSLEAMSGNEESATHRSFVKAESPRKTVVDELRVDIDRLQMELLSLAQWREPSANRGDRPDLREAVAANRNSIQALQTKQLEILEALTAQQQMVDSFTSRIAAVVQETVCADDEARDKFAKIFENRFAHFDQRVHVLEASMPFAEVAAQRLAFDCSTSKGDRQVLDAFGVSHDALTRERLSKKLGEPLTSTWHGFNLTDRDADGREPEKAGSEFHEDQRRPHEILSAIHEDPDAIVALTADMRNARAAVAAQEELCRSVRGDLRRRQERLLDLEQIYSRALIDAPAGKDAQLLQSGKEAEKEQFSREKREVLLAISAIREELRACRANGFVSAVATAAATTGSPAIPETTGLIAPEMEDEPQPVGLQQAPCSEDKHNLFGWPEVPGLEVLTPSQEMEPVVEGSDEDGPSDDDSDEWED